jgi:DNA replication protein DnaD
VFSNAKNTNKPYINGILDRWMEGVSKTIGKHERENQESMVQNGVIASSQPHKRHQIFDISTSSKYGTSQTRNST